MRCIRRTVWCTGLLATVALGCGNAETRGGREAQAPPQAQSSERTLAELVRVAVSADDRAAAEATAGLRAHGSKGLDALLGEAEQRGVLAALGGEPKAAVDPDEIERFRRAIDRTARQRDAHASRLYWHTDLTQALAEAQAREKPVLSLRLLGNLDEELSCANSRFFRTALYANAEISKYLRDRYVLHWQSVRPAPKITIDFGDGRKLERTITGNSIHYVLSPDGHVVDALPGLYGPRAFLRVLEAAEQTVLATRALPKEQTADVLREHHESQGSQLALRRDEQLATLGVRAPSLRRPLAALPSAANAAPRAMSKVIVEAPMVAELLPRQRGALALVNDEKWKELAREYAAESKLDAASKALMFRKTAVELNAQSATPAALTPEAFARLVERFEGSIAEDTARNELEFRLTILEWLAAEPARALGLDALNARVYSELFLTPDEDRWLGLVEPDVFTAIPNQGLSLDARTVR